MIAFHVDETLVVKLLRIDNRTVHVGEQFELISAPHVIAIAGSAVRNDFAAIDLFDLTGSKGSIILYSAAMRRIQRSDLTAM